jgi:hypothetical protein
MLQGGPSGSFVPEFCKMNLSALKGGVFYKRCIVHEVRSVRKLFNRGVYCHFLLVLPILTALKGGVLDPTANKTPRFAALEELGRMFQAMGSREP